MQSYDQQLLSASPCPKAAQGKGRHADKGISPPNTLLLRLSMMKKDLGCSRDTWSVSKITQELLGKREEMKQISTLSYQDDSSASHLIFSVLCLMVMKHRSEASASPM